MHRKKRKKLILIIRNAIMAGSTLFACTLFIIQARSAPQATPGWRTENHGTDSVVQRPPVSAPPLPDAAEAPPLPLAGQESAHENAGKEIPPDAATAASGETQPGEPGDNLQATVAQPAPTASAESESSSETQELGAGKEGLLPKQNRGWRSREELEQQH